MMEENKVGLTEAVQLELNEIYRNIMGTENFFACLFMIHKLLSNIITSPDDPKFRKLNLSNPNISGLFSKTSSVEKLFRLLKFKPVENDQFLQIGQPDQPIHNLQDLKLAVSEIEELGNKISSFFLSHR